MEMGIILQTKTLLGKEKHPFIIHHLCSFIVTAQGSLGGGTGRKLKGKETWEGEGRANFGDYPTPTDRRDHYPRMALPSLSAREGLISSLV